MPQVNVRVNDGFVVLVTVRSLGCCGLPGRTKQVPGFPPYSLSHTAGSLMCSRIVWLVGTPALHVALPTVWVEPSNGMLVGSPLGLMKENLSVPSKGFQES